jgi:hypothetical protein
MPASNSKQATQHKNATERHSEPSVAPKKRRSQVHLTVAHVYAQDCDAATTTAIVDELARLIESRRTA